jgi:hypothetical protein
MSGAILWIVSAGDTARATPTPEYFGQGRSAQDVSKCPGAGTIWRPDGNRLDITPSLVSGEISMV